MSTEQAADILHRVRVNRPRVHCLMNTVAQKFTAGGITAVGGIPSMTSSVDEVGSFMVKADAMTVNLGTLDADKRKAILLAVDVDAVYAAKGYLQAALQASNDLRVGHGRGPVHHFPRGWDLS